MDQTSDTISRHALLAPFIGGLLAHLISHHVPPASLPAFALVILGIPITLSITLQPQSLFLYFLKATIIYLVTLGASITAYRLSPFHPLAKYPGPILARVSRLWAALGVVRGFQYLESHALFEKYGEVVRTGPNHLLMRNASAITAIHGTKDRWPRHARQIVSVPYESKGNVVTIIQPAEHSKRRRIWDRAFTPSAIKSYEPLLQHRLSQLLTALSSRTSTPIDVAEWFGLFTVDFMGDFAFGGTFNMLKEGKDTQGLHKSITDSTKMIDLFGTMPWLRPVMLRMPKSKARKMQTLALGVAEHRKKLGSQTRDLFYYLLQEDREGEHEATEMSPIDMAMEAVLALGAGSDTTSVALSNAIYYLITYPAVFARLRAELDAAAGEAGVEDLLDPDRLAELEYLHAVINETLRLQPAVPNGVQRTAHDDRGPLIVAGHVIPPGTNVQIPTWSIHRDPRYFSPSPEAFWPERWLPNEGPKTAEASGQEFVLAQGAYMPFHYGAANCVGKALALHEMRTVISALVRRFNFAFAPGFEGSDWVTRLQEKFVLFRAELKVVMTERLVVKCRLRAVTRRIVRDVTLT